MTDPVGVIVIAGTVIGVACMVAMVVLLWASVREDKLARRDHEAFVRELGKLLQR